jgi:hypothetical protein
MLPWTGNTLTGAAPSAKPRGKVPVISLLGGVSAVFTNHSIDRAPIFPTTFPTLRA